MLRFLFRILATLSLAAALILGVLDATRSIALSQVVTTPLGDSWLLTFPESLLGAQSLVGSTLGETAWDLIVSYILAWPGFAVFTLLALLFYALGRRRDRRIGPFAAEA